MQEVTQRMYSGVAELSAPGSEAFCTFMRPLHFWWIAYAVALGTCNLCAVCSFENIMKVLVAADYLFGVTISVSSCRQSNC